MCYDSSGRFILLKNIYISLIYCVFKQILRCVINKHKGVYSIHTLCVSLHAVADAIVRFLKPWNRTVKRCVTTTHLDVLRNLQGVLRKHALFKSVQLISTENGSSQMFDVFCREKTTINRPVGLYKTRRVSRCFLKSTPLFLHLITFVPRARVSFGQHQDTELWNNQQARSQSPRVFCF